MGLNSFFALLIGCLFPLGEVFSQDLVEIRLIDSISVSFDSGSAVIKNPSKVISRINQTTLSHGKIHLIAYTDTVGSYSYNKSLASKRLLAVSKLIDSTSIRNLMMDSTNQNEKRTKTSLGDDSFRRVDILIYSVEPKIKLGTPVNLRINFNPETTNFIPGSLENVKALQILMEMDTTLQIKLNGYVCCRPDLILSLHRAEKVKSYLIDHGIAANRISCYGYSNTRALVPETSEENKKMNRRVEVVFIK
ncbi:Outer membrane porin F precursor [compost metagenome]